MKCPLCGTEFEEDELQQACKGCPISKNCGLLRCPNCGYEFPPEPKLVKKLRRLRRKEKRTKYDFKKVDAILSNGAEDILKEIYLNYEDGKDYIEIGKIKDKKDKIKELLTGGYIARKKNRLIFKDKGYNYAKDIIRRHRLAERLMQDVLMVSDETVHKSACEFEHIIQSEIEERICTLLGHPKFCPHGKPIPPGECCISAKWIVEPLIKPLTVFNPGDGGVIAYLHTKDERKIRKLINLGILPGVKIRLIQKFPSFVIQVGNSQIATDKETVEDIYVRVVENKS